MPFEYAVVTLKLLNRLRSPIIRDVLGIGIIKLISIPATLAISIMLARNLGPNDFGTYAFVISLTNLAALTLTGGLSQLMTREVAFALQNDAKGILKGLIHSATTWVLCSSLAIMLCAWFVMQLAVTSNDQSLRTALHAALLALPIVALSPVWSGTLRGYGHGAQSQYPGLLLVPLGQLLAVAGLVTFGLLSVRTAILAFIVANVIAAAVGLYLTKATVSNSLRNVAAEYQVSAWAKSCVIFTGIALMTFLQTQAGVILLGFLSSTADVAAFQIADRGAQMVVLAAAIIELVLAPHVARAFKAGSHDQLKSIFLKARRVGGLVTIFVALPLIFAGAPIVQLAFGSAYVELAVEPLAIISAALSIRAFLGPTTTFLAMTNNERYALAAQSFGLILNISLTLLLAPRLGAVGAASAAAVGIVVWSALLAFKTKKTLGIQVLKL